MEVNLVEISKLSLGPNDTLVVNVTSDEISMEHVVDLKNRLQTMFPNNKIIMSILPVNSAIEFQVISPKEG